MAVLRLTVNPIETLDTGMIRLKGMKANSFIRFLWIMEKIRAFKVLLEAICALGDFYKGHFVVYVNLLKLIGLNLLEHVIKVQKDKENYVFVCSHQA